MAQSWSGKTQTTQAFSHRPQLLLEARLPATLAVRMPCSQANHHFAAGTPANYWDWQCNEDTCCTAASLAKGQIGKCKGALGEAPTTPTAWADFVQKPAQRSTVFDLNVVQTNASYQVESSH